MHPTVLAVMAEDHHAQLLRDADFWRRANLAERRRPRRRTARRIVTSVLGRLRTSPAGRLDTPRAADLCCA